MQNNPVERGWERQCFFLFCLGRLKVIFFVFLLCYSRLFPAPHVRRLQYYKISTKIGQRKIENIKVSEASVVTSGCPACMLQLSTMLSQAGSGVVVKHPVEIYTESITKN
jgi:hypothetical protein